MPTLNPRFFELPQQYLFQQIEKEKQGFLSQNPSSRPLLNLGIGDIALPISPKIAKAISDAALDMAQTENFKGYGPSGGYDFLKKAIAKHEYKDALSPDEIFISDGSKGDTAHILNIFSKDNVIGLSDPAYPVYLESSILKGMQIGGPKLVFLPCLRENDFLPLPPEKHLDIIFLCSPNNPTGTAFSYDALKKWVAYARENHSIILYDSAYSCFIQKETVPKSIYEIPGAHEVAIEFRSFSKSLGFTGLRLAYTVVPKALRSQVSQSSETASLHSLWKRHQDMKFGGASYPIQKGALAYYSDPEAKSEAIKRITGYLQQALRLKTCLQANGIFCFGGEHSPYLWLKTPQKSSSWEYFHQLLEEKQIIGIPGKGFGEHGEGYLRLSCFCSPYTLEECLKRFRK